MAATRKGTGKGTGKGTAKGAGKGTMSDGNPLDREASTKDAKKARKAARAEVSAAVEATAAATELAKDAAKAKRHATETAEAAVRASETAAAVEAQASDVTTVVPRLLADLLRVDSGFTLADVDTRGTPGFDGGKKEGKAALEGGVSRLSELQERLFAQGRTGDTRALLLVIQGMDTSGKGGIVRHVLGAVDPQGVALTSFKAPTAAERAKGFLWRIRQALPGGGYIGVFDRSHYEDVLIVRVRDLVPRATWMRRYGSINTFEKGVVERGTRVVKVMLHVSKDEQRERLAERLDRPDKYWKYNPGDVDERLLWDDYAEAYQAVLDRTSSDAAPWYVVPADRKWYARWAVQQLLLDHLSAMDPQWPDADYDIEEEKARLAAS